MSSTYVRAPHHLFQVDAAEPMARPLTPVHTAVPPGPHTQDPGIFYSGTVGNDAQAGTSGDDGFDYSQGGNDSLSGFEGNDEFYFGATFDKFDSINGGTDYDILFLDGEYDAPVDPWLATTLVSIEEIRLAAGHFYRFGLNDANVAAGQTLIIDAHTLTQADGLGFFGGNETDGRFVIYGGASGNGSFVGYGADVVFGRGGDDVVWCPDSSLQLKTLDGGDGQDIAAPQLSGGAVMVLSNSTLQNFEEILFQPHANLGTIGVTLDMADGNVKKDQVFVIQMQGTTGTTIDLWFDGSLETNGSFEVHAHGGDDTLIGGARGDRFETAGFGGGSDRVYGGGGNDIVRPWETCDASDIFEGGSGNDTLELRGDYSGGLVFGAASLVSVETIDLLNVASYAITFDDANVARNKSLTVDGSGTFGPNHVNLNASAETNGSVTLLGGGANDILVGGAQADTLIGNNGNDVLLGTGGRDHIDAGEGDDRVHGGAGADVLTGGIGHDWYEIDNVADSTGRNFDEIVGFDARDMDTIALLNLVVSGVDAKVTGGALSDNAGFNHDLADAIGKQQLHAGHAVLFQPGSGGLAGEVFLVIDANGKAGYQPNKDFVVLLTDGFHLGNLNTADFAVAT